jgi:IPT/TIG domain
MRIGLPLQIPITWDAMSIDETGSRIFLISTTGLTIVQLAQVPLSIGTITPNSGPASGGTTLIIRGSGFANGAKVNFQNTEVQATVIDANTINVLTPVLPTGPVRLTVVNPDGSQYSLDAAYTAQ